MLEALDFCQQLHKSTLRTLCNTLEAWQEADHVEEELHSVSYRGR